MRLNAMQQNERNTALYEAQGKVYSEIRRETGASSATVSRVNRMLNYGTGSVAESVREDLAAQGIPADAEK